MGLRTFWELVQELRQGSGGSVVRVRGEEGGTERDGGEVLEKGGEEGE